MKVKTIGTVQTVKAEQSLKSLKKLSGPVAKVFRDGVVVQIPTREIVVGDMVLLEAGDYVPADGRAVSKHPKDPGEERVHRF